MATQELKVKFKVDASGVKSGADDAKNEVKKAASEMESDVKRSSDSMESHLDKVADSAKNIEGAADSAGNAVKGLEQQVNQSSSSMEKSLDAVAEKVKGISVKQGVGIASRALGVAGNVAGWIGENMAEDEGSKAGWDAASAALNGAGQGAMLGASIGTLFGPIGTAIGGAAGALAGAAAGLFSASKELEKAAKDLEKSSESKMLNAGKDLYERNRLTGYEKETNRFVSRLDAGAITTGDIYNEQQKRQEWLNQKIAERDQFVSEHQYDTGEAAVNAANRLDLLERAIQVAQERIAAFAPAVQAAQQKEEEGVRAAQAAIEERKKEAAAIRAEVEAREKIAKQAQSTIQQHATSLADKERLAGYGRENQEILKNSGLTGVVDAWKSRKDELDKAISERDEYVRQNQNVTGEAAIEVAKRLAELDQAVDLAKEHFESLSPLIKDLVKEGNEKKKEAEQSLAETQRQLQGVISNPFLGSKPTDALTRIGGGRGYTSYNNSTARVQMSIESHLKTLVANQQNQLQQIINKLENLNVNGTWA